MLEDLMLNSSGTKYFYLVLPNRELAILKIIELSLFVSLPFFVIEVEIFPCLLFWF